MSFGPEPCVKDARGHRCAVRSGSSANWNPPPTARSNDDASNASYEVLPAVNCRNMLDPPTPSPPPNDFASLLKAVPSDNCQGRCAKDAEPVQSWARAGVAIARLT